MSAFLTKGIGYDRQTINTTITHAATLNSTYSSPLTIGVSGPDMRIFGQTHLDYAVGGGRGLAPLPSNPLLIHGVGHGAFTISANVQLEMGLVQHVNHHI